MPLPILDETAHAPRARAMPAGARRQQLHPAPLFEALAECVESGRGLGDVLPGVQRLGGASGRWAGRLASSLRTERSALRALAKAEGVTPPEARFVESLDEETPLGPVLRLLAARRRGELRWRRRLRGALLGPAVALLLTLLTLPLPELITGGRYWPPLLRSLAWLVAAVLLVAIALPRLARLRRVGRALRWVATRLPFIRGLVQSHEEGTLARALSVAAHRGLVTAGALRSARWLLAESAWSDALGAIAAEQPSSTPVLAELQAMSSEPLALCLFAGTESDHLGASLVRFADEGAAAVADRVTRVLRIALWAVVIGLGVHGAVALANRPIPIPGLGGALDGSGLDLSDLNDLKGLEQLLERLTK